MEQANAVQIGLGLIGQEIVRLALERSGIEVIGAVDPAPGKSGKDLAKVCGIDGNIGINVCADVETAMAGNKPDVALLATVSGMKEIVPQVEKLLKCGVNVISTCEELSFPWKTFPDLSERLDKVAKKHNVSVLATGVNPGFLMDFLPIAMTSVCRKVESIKVSRLQDASCRRVPFRKKIGAGLTVREFEQKKREGTIRHVGLKESMHMIAWKMGWELERTEETIEPVIAEKEVIIEGFEIKAGAVAGVEQIGKGFLDGRQVITLEFKASVGESVSVDRIEIKGTPDIVSVIEGGVNGDIATCAIVVNAIRPVIAASPGLRTMIDIPMF